MARFSRGKEKKRKEEEEEEEEEVTEHKMFDVCWTVHRCVN